MGILERKLREKEQRHQHIIDAAEKVFFTKGIQAATMDDVAQMAELSKGTLYLYFKNKEELYFAMHLRGLKILAELFEKALQSESAGLQKIQAIGQAYYQFSLQYPNYFNALIYYESHTVDVENQNSIAVECHHLGQQTLNFVIEALKSGLQDGTIRPEIDPVKAAIILWGQSSGLIQLLALKGEHVVGSLGISHETMIHYAYDLILEALKKR